jgi:hypothetical protein
MKVSLPRAKFYIPQPRECNVVTHTATITTRPALENTLALLTISTVMVRTVAPQPGLSGGATSVGLCLAD